MVHIFPFLWKKHTEDKVLLAFILALSCVFCFMPSFQSRQKPSKTALAVLMESWDQQTKDTFGLFMFCSDLPCHQQQGSFPCCYIARLEMCVFD